MKINGRLLLLMAVAAMFMRVWKVNEPTRTRNAPRTRIGRPVVVVPAPDRDEGIAVAPVSVVQVAESSMPQEREWSAAECPLPLPAGIAPGIYRVASDDGRIARLVVPVARDAAKSPEGSVDFLAVTIEGVRWYFIRLNVAVVVAEELPAPAPVVAEEIRQPTISSVLKKGSDPAGEREFFGESRGPERVRPLFQRPASADDPAVATGVSAVIQQAERPRPPALPSPL